MPNETPLNVAVLSPLAWIGRGALGGTAYLGGLVTLSTSALGSAIRPAGDSPRFLPTTTRQLAWMLGMGMPLIALMHVGLGSFLSMQAYFGGTFVDGTGAVVGVGLIRNVAPLMTGLTLAGLFAARITPELRARGRIALDPDPRSVPDRDSALGLGQETSAAPNPARLAAVRLAAAIVAGPVLTAWAILVGTVVGWQVAQTLLGVSTESFFFMFTQMLWLRDVIGLFAKGVLYALFSALFACYEGLRQPEDADPQLVPAAACRAACFAAVAILALNSIWFLLFYHAGAAFGPTLLAPPSS